MQKKKKKTVNLSGELCENVAFLPGRIAGGENASHLHLWWSGFLFLLLFRRQKIIIVLKLEYERNEIVFTLCMLL